MRKRGYRALAMLLPLLASVVGCASVPKKADARECLVIVPTKVSNARGGSIPYTFKYAFLPELPLATVGPKYTAVKIAREGTIVNDLYLYYPGKPKWSTGNSIPLPYRPGKLAIADYTLTIHVVFEDSRWLTRTKFKKTEEADRLELLASLRADGRFSDWLE